MNRKQLKEYIDIIVKNIMVIPALVSFAILIDMNPSTGGIIITNIFIYLWVIYMVLDILFFFYGKGDE